jgi:hypothetical protein
MLPKLTVNRQFMDNFLVEKTPCFALGMIEAAKRKMGLLALRSDEIIPRDILGHGFNFGHSLLGNSQFEIVHFAFDFYGFRTYNVLINPNNPLIQAVLTAMIDGDEYFFLMIGPDQNITTFQSGGRQTHLESLKENIARIRHSSTNDAQYRQALQQFQKHPDPPGSLLSFVCYDNIAYLDLTNDRMELTPAKEAAAPVRDNADAVQRRNIAERFNDKVNDLMRSGVNNDLMIMSHMANDLSLFKRLMDISSHDDMDDLCAAYPGFHRFAKAVEKIAADIQSGDIKMPKC